MLSETQQAFEQFLVDPAREQVAAAKEAGCEAVELHTGTYANACMEGFSPEARAKVAGALAEIGAGLSAGLDAGLVVSAGHGLTYANVAPVAATAGFSEFNIGHSIIARAVFVGLRQAVAEMKRLIGP